MENMSSAHPTCYDHRVSRDPSQQEGPTTGDKADAQREGKTRLGVVLKVSARKAQTKTTAKQEKQTNTRKHAGTHHNREKREKS